VTASGLPQSPSQRSLAAARCQGAGMARLEMRVLIEEVLDAIPDYEIANDGVAFRTSRAFIR